MLSGQGRRGGLLAVFVMLTLLLCRALPAIAMAECWPAPIDAAVLDGFRAPRCTWCVGNRGIEYQVQAPRPVRSVAAGTVTYSGVVAGTRFVVIELFNGWLVTYGRLGSTRLVTGDAVTAGSVVGTAMDAFYFGLRVDGEYRDPAPYLGHLVGPARLVPTDGRAPRPVSGRRYRCAVGDGRVAR
jgi:murein DD-endopeptidase MepM/ murein hydrolase activator NlpD